MDRAACYPVPVEEVPRTWAEFQWPEWVPLAVREQIEDFWLEALGRGPREWIKDMARQGSPKFGEVVTCRLGFGKNAPFGTGRWVHAWNNIGRLVHEDGSFSYTSFFPGGMLQGSSPKPMQASDS